MKKLMIAVIWYAVSMPMVHTLGLGKQISIKADVSFMIADLKVSQQEIKILELGDATWSGFKGFGYIYGVGSAWRLFWEYLESLQLPIFLVGNPSSSEKSLDLCRQNPNFVQVASLFDLAHHPLFRSLSTDLTKPHGMTRSSVLGYKGIIVCDRYRSIGEHILVAKRYPNFLVLNEAIHESAQYKHLTGRLFDEQELMTYRPRFMVCKRLYTSTLAESIKRKLPASCYVLKPAYASQGHGVVMVKTEELEETLKFILGESHDVDRFKAKSLTLTDYHDSYGYWHRPTIDQDFIVEEFVQSKAIIVEGKPYDATMRFLFSLQYDDGKIGFIPLGAYWKRPIKSLIEEGSFRQQHLSHIPKIRPTDEFVMGTKVSEQDFAYIVQTLQPVLKKLYKKMLVIHQNNPVGLIGKQPLRNDIC